MKFKIYLQYGIPLRILWGVLGLLSVMLILIFEYPIEPPFFELIKLCLLSLVFVTVIILYIMSQIKKLKDIPYFSITLVGIYFLSLLVLFLTKGSDQIFLWMFGGLAIAMLLDVQLGYIIMYTMIFFSAFIGKLGMDSVIFLLLIGTVFCLLSNYLSNLTTIDYAAIIIVSLEIIMIFIKNTFMFNNATIREVVYSVVITLAIIACSFGCFSLYEKLLIIKGIRLKSYTSQEDSSQALQQNFHLFNIFHKKDESKKSQTSIEQSSIEQQKEMQPLQEELKETKQYQEMQEDLKYLSGQELQVEQELQEQPQGNHSLDEILSLDFPLIERLKKLSKKTYSHTLLISELSGRAAAVAGVNEKIVKAGGLYHEIGRLEGKEYVEEGVKLAEAYHLPPVIVDIIRQHNLKYEKPRTPEAAIVMLTVSVVATIEYLEKTGKRNNGNDEKEAISINKIVDNIFQMRLSKGSLDESGLTVQQYNSLRDFYLHM